MGAGRGRNDCLRRLLPTRGRDERLIPRRSSPYREDLAYLHDLEFGFFARSAAETLRRCLKRQGFRSGRVVDLGCGSGILCEALANRGYELLGIDLSPAMLRMARRRAPTAVFRRGSFLSTALPSAVGVAAVGECFNYAGDEEADDRALARLFRRVHDALEPGGVFLFDMAEPGRLEGERIRKTHWEGDGWAVLVTAEEDRRRKRLVRRISTFRRVGARFRRHEEVHHLRLVPSATITRLLQESGFTVRKLSGYYRFPFPPGVVGYQCVGRPPQRARRM